MTFSLKHIGFLIGVGCTFLSFLFFGRQLHTYQILLICGLLIVSVFYLLILIGKDHIKTKILWTIVLILSIVLLMLTEPFLIDTSYRIYICQNKKILNEINHLLLNKQDDIAIYNDSIYDNAQLNTSEINKLREGQKKLGVYIIAKSDEEVYYGLWGFLDIRLGVIYLPDKIKVHNNYRHLTGNWFHLQKSDY